MASAETEAQVAALFGEVQRRIDVSDFRAAVARCDDILKVLPGDEDALRTKAVALIQDGDADAALALIAGTPVLRESMVFEQAYCLFRQRKFEASLKLVNSVSEPSPALLELRAQLLYRLERFNESLAAYASTVEATRGDEFDEERQANISAVYAAAAATAVAAAEIPPAPDAPLPQTTYEQSYNAGCYDISLKQFERGARTLQKAMEMCRAFLQEDPDITEEEIVEELNLLSVQLGVAKQLGGSTEEAQKLYQGVLKNKPADIALVAVASNNLIAINKDRDVFDSKKKIKAATQEGLQKKLAQHQLEAIDMNHCLLLMYMNQGDVCRRTAAELMRKYPDSDIGCLILAASLHRDKREAEAMKVLREYAEAHPASSARVQLALAQECLAVGNAGEAAATLESIASLQHRPGVVGTVVALRQLRGQTAEAAAAIDAAVAFWAAEAGRDSSGGARKAHRALLRASAAFKSQQGLWAAAAADWRALLELERDNAAALGQLVLALAQTDLAQAEEVAAALPEIAADSSGLNVDALESDGSRLAGSRRSAGGAAAAAAAAAQSAAAQSAAADGKAAEGGAAAAAAAAAAGGGGADVLAVGADGAAVRPKRKRKKRPGKLPKDYNPNIPPDPERWLPKWERKDFRRRRRDRHKDVSRGTQGSTRGLSEAPPPAAKKTSSTTSDGAAGAAAAAGAAGAAAAAAGPAAAAAGPAPSTGGGGRQQQNKKKKKKGKK